MRVCALKAAAHEVHPREHANGSQGIECLIPSLSLSVSTTVIAPPRSVR